MYTVVLKPKEEKRAMRHPWIYANEVAKVEGKDVQGSIARVESFDRRLVGYGFINHHSKILVRILSRKEEAFDRDFFAARIVAADRFRTEKGYHDAYRVVFGESDDLPGLVIDKYGDYLSVQFLCLGMDVRKEMILSILVQHFAPKGIMERSDVSVREKEGLALYKGVVYGEVPDCVPICENGSTLFVDLRDGQKTGYFLDQAANRAAIERYVKGKRVADCFCNVGGFSMCAAKAGASEIVAVDISERALSFVQKSARANGYQITTCQADVFEWLRLQRKEGQRYDVIVLDPPAFTKSKDTVSQAVAGYKDINISALKLLSDRGILITCSCSQHLTLPLFLNMLSDSVQQAGKRAKLLDIRMQGQDHAALLGEEESLYLKVAVLQLF